WEELPAIYARADVLCAPSRHDGWGLVVPEGLAAGLPVIATDRTGAAIDLVDEGRNGWLVRAGSESALVNAVRRVAKLDENELLRMSAAATLRARAHTLEEGARRFLAACEFRDHVL